MLVAVANRTGYGIAGTLHETLAGMATDRTPALTATLDRWTARAAGAL